MILEHDLLTNPETVEIFANLPRTTRIVDIGCGIRPCPVFRCAEYVCIQPHGEYIEHLREWRRDGQIEIVNGEAELVAKQPREDTTVLLLDVIEHMEKPRGEAIRDLLTEFEHAVIFTPLGWYEQDGKNPDCWGLNGGYWQKHRSQWQPEDFPQWAVTVWPEWHQIQPVGAIMAIR